MFATIFTFYIAVGIIFALLSIGRIETEIKYNQEIQKMGIAQETTAIAFIYFIVMSVLTIAWPLILYYAIKFYIKNKEDFNLPHD